MNKILLSFFGLCALAVSFYGVARIGAVNEKESRALSGIADTRSNSEQVVREVFTALKRGDSKALQELLVSDDEYRDVILTGSVPPGEPQARMPREKAEFFTQLHRTKSQYALADLMNAVRRVGGELTAIRWEGTGKAYASYTLLPRPVLVVSGPAGSEEIRPGLLVELNGRVRVLSYFSDG